MNYETKTIILSNISPILGDTYVENKFTVKGEQKIILDLSNIHTETSAGEIYYIYKTRAQWGDGADEYYESVYNSETLKIEPPKTIEHTYSITTSADVLKGVVYFEFQNGLTSFSQLCAFCSKANLIDLQMKNLENQLFVVEKVQKLTTYVDKDNNLYNLALTPTMLTRYDSSQQDIIEIPPDERIFLQTSELGDFVNALSSVDVQATDAPSKAPIDYTGSRFVVY